MVSLFKRVINSGWGVFFLMILAMGLMDGLDSLVIG